jgi:hypothetical protein
MLATRTVASAALTFALAAGTASAQLRIVQWNITNWSSADVSTRGPSFQTSFYGVVPSGTLANQSLSPDLIIAEEITQGGSGSSPAHQSAGQANVDAFRTLLNNACGCTNDWQAAPYVVNGGDTGAALFYRGTKFNWLDTTLLTQNTGTGADQAPRDTTRWHIRVLGYAGTTAELYIYGSHFKAGDASSDQARRNPEATRIRNDSNALPTNIGGFFIAADFNIQASSQQAYQTLVSGATSGQFIDPINAPGTWNNNSAFRYIHTQEPSTQMDDRHDQLLLSGQLLHHQGLAYIFTGTTINGANPYGIPAFSTATWNDPNHTYRCWGNDGAHFNTAINVAPTNAQVGQTIADALVVTVAGNGHLPAYLDMQIPAKLGAPSGTIDLGAVSQNSSVSYSLQITNAADTARFSKGTPGNGIDVLSYSFAISGTGFSIPGGNGPFERSAGSPAPVSTHTVSLDTTSLGPKSATLTITSDDPDNPTRVITFMANVQSSTSSGACCTPATGACSLVLFASCTGGNTWNGAVSCSPQPCPQPVSGACCTPSTGACSIMVQTACTGSNMWNGAASCSPQPCPQPAVGACCNGTTCSSTTQNACAGVFQGVAIACGPVNNPTICCPANFDQINGLSVQDIFGFLGHWLDGDPRCDFDGDGTLSFLDLFGFLNAWFAGC